MTHRGATTDTEEGGTLPSLGRVVALAADLLGAPAARLVLMRGDRAVAVASVGAEASPRDTAWGFPLSQPAPLSIPDLSAEPRAPLFSPGAPRFYAGAPVLASGGGIVGALCVLDGAPRPALPPGDLARLAALAGLAGDALEAERARERAEAVAEAKAGLLADVSHELRTPLGGIVGFARNLSRDGALDRDALLAAERIEEAGRGLLSIVDDALDLTRFESGLVRLDPRPFPPARFVEDAAAMVRPEADRKGLDLVVDLPADLPPALLADPDRLRQVVLNLLSNAVKFTERGTVRVALAVGPGTAAGVPVSVSVEDSGIGLTVEGASRLFRRFAQADETVARRHGGNGLGLAISRTLVEAMGGSIAVESAPGAGARFTVSLVLPRAPAPRPLEAPHRGGMPEPDGLAGLAILVAEDAAINQKLVMEMLEPLGAAVDVVGDGAAAVEAAKRRDYALVLMDMEMPVLDGVEATRRIRGLGGAAGAVPIVALTANVFPEQLALCRAAGMDDHLTKPFGPDDLAAVATRWARRAVPGEGGGLG